MENIKSDALLMYELLKTQSMINGLAKKLLTPDKFAEFLKEERGRIVYHVSEELKLHGKEHSWLSQLQTLVDRDSDPLED